MKKPDVPAGEASQQQHDVPNESETTQDELDLSPPSQDRHEGDEDDSLHDDEVTDSDSENVPNVMDTLSFEKYFGCTKRSHGKC